MKILDCESSETIDNSLESIIGAPINEIEEFLINFDCEDMYERKKYAIDDDIRDIIANEISKKFSAKCNYDATCWFHITRAFNKKDFEYGIIPLSEIIDKIWNDIFKLMGDDFTESQWLEFRIAVEKDSLGCWYAHLYKLKLNNEIGQGPFAILIKELAYPDNHMNNIDFIDLPEIVRDICGCFDEIHNYNLVEKYLENTKKYIIKFKSNDHESFDLGSALVHKMRLLKGMPKESYPVCCFDGKGEAVPPEDILKIEDAATRPISIEED